MNKITTRPPTHHVDDDGTELVTITRARFEELLAAEEDADDLAAAIKGRKSIDEEGAVPAVVARAIRAGQNPVYAWRRYNGMTQADLADRVDVTQAAIARLEAAPVGSGRRATLEAIAEALGAPIDSLDPIDNSPVGKMRRVVAESTDALTGRVLRVASKARDATPGMIASSGSAKVTGEIVARAASSAMMKRDSKSGKIVGKRIMRPASAKPFKEKG